MYTLAIRTDFIARHRLVGGDWGTENLPNSHHYVLELQLEGQELDAHGFLVDIVEVENHLRAVTAYFRESMLNELPEFKGLNPSLEHFSRICAETLGGRIHAANIRALRVVLWENAEAWAAFTVQRAGP